MTYLTLPQDNAGATFKVKADLVNIIKEQGVAVCQVKQQNLVLVLRA